MMPIVFLCHEAGKTSPATAAFVMMLLNRWDGSRSWLPTSNQPTLLLDHIESLAPSLIPTLNDLEHRVLESGLPPDSAEDP